MTDDEIEEIENQIKMKVAVKWVQMMEFYAKQFYKRKQMMDTVKDFVSSIASGENLDAEQHFNCPSQRLMHWKQRQEVAKH